MIKYSVIGTSWITRSFIEGAALTGELLLDGVYSRSVQKGEAFRKETGAQRSFSDLGELLGSDTELVYVASPNSCHYSQCKALLEAGKHVICEKPITITAEEFDTLTEIAREKALVYFEAIMYMHSPRRAVLKEWVEKIGRIRSANIDFSQFSSKYPLLLDYESGKSPEMPNIFNPLMKTGALNDLGIYCVYPVIDLFGEPQKITAFQHFLSTGADGCGSAVYEYEDKLVTITYSKTGQSQGVSQIIGDKGTITIESISQTDGLSLYDTKGERLFHISPGEKKYCMMSEAQSAVDFIKNYDESSAFLEECQAINRKVLLCMEKMRTDNA